MLSGIPPLTIYGSFFLATALRPARSKKYCIRAKDRLFVTGTLQVNPAIDQRNENSVRCSPAGGLAYLSPEAAALQRELALPGLEKLPASARFSIQKQNGWNMNPPVLLMKGPIRRSFSDLLEQSAVYASRSGLLFRDLHLGWPNPNARLSLHLADPILFIAATACTSLD